MSQAIYASACLNVDGATVDLAPPAGQAPPAPVASGGAGVYVVKRVVELLAEYVLEKAYGAAAEQTANTLKLLGNAGNKMARMRSGMKGG